MHLGGGERRQMEAQANTLRELLELGRVELVVELGLAGQDDPQHLLLGGLDTGEQPHFFQHPQE